LQPYFVNPERLGQRPGQAPSARRAGLNDELPPLGTFGSHIAALTQLNRSKKLRIFT
jgi:hypothetical protein